MKCLRSSAHATPSNSPLPNAKTQLARVLIFALLSLACFGQDASQSGQAPDSRSKPAESSHATLTIPAGTHIILVLTHPIQSRSVRRGDDIYAQISAPVTSGKEMAIPPGTFIQGTVDKLEQKSGRGNLHLQSMSITFPDGYVTSIPGPINWESDEGYALKDPGHGRVAAAFVLPAAGAGLGALIGHSVASSNPVTITSSVPPGCTGPPPGCVSSSLTTGPDKLKSTAIGSMVGLAAGGVASVVILVRSRNFYLDVGAPMEMTLPQAVSLRQDEVAEAVNKSEQRPAPVPIAQRPFAPPSPNAPDDHGTCYTPGTPGTPPTVIPGTPGPDGVPGPPTVIPGTPPTPGTPYPCP